jgi:hypothetical protein
MRTTLWLMAGLVLAVAAPAVRAQEEKVPLDKVPKAVADTVKKRFPRAEVLGSTKEPDDAGKTVYEVQIKDQGHNIDVTVTPEGTLVSIERTIEEKDLPKKAAATLQSRWPGAKYEIIEEVIHVKDGKETLDYYEVLMATADKKKMEACVTADGKITKTEEKKPGDK